MYSLKGLSLQKAKKLASKRGIKSTVQQGNEFRDLVSSMLEAAGFVSETEIRVDSKKVDVVWRREDLDGPVRYLVEAKDHSGSLPRNECHEFRAEYGPLVDDGKADYAWLISRGDIVSDGRSVIDSHRFLKAMTFAEFQRRLFGLDSYLQGLIAEYENDKIGQWYVHPHTDQGEDLEKVVREWIDRPQALPLAIVSGYGRGKSTFARHLAASLARDALASPACRVPVLVPLGNIIDEQSLEGLLGKVFTLSPGIRGYNFGLFGRMNQAGRFVVIFDGFDEMKHGMTLARFEANVVELMRLDRDTAKLIVLGRDTAFHDDVEFQSIIHGQQRTVAGAQVQIPGRRPFSPIGLRDFTLDEAKSFVRRFFPIAAREAARDGKSVVNDKWISDRIETLLSGRYDPLLVRPVHAQMLCQIATDRNIEISDLSRHGLFDRFVHFLLDREVRKRGRDRRFSLDVRRRFNSALALWLWRQGGVSTVSLMTVPASICHEATEKISHDFDEYALRKELTAGCLIEKAGGTIYFGHRSLQEFLVAEAILIGLPDFRDDFFGVIEAFRVINPEVAAFTVEAAASSPIYKAKVSDWLALFEGQRRSDIPFIGFKIFVDLAIANLLPLPPPERDPWFMWLAYFKENGRVAFLPRNRGASDALQNLLRQGLNGTNEMKAAAMILAAHALSNESEDRIRIATHWLASSLDPKRLQKLVVDAAKCRGAERTYVIRDRDPALWAHLYATRTVRSESETLLEIDLTVIVRRMSSVIPIGLADGSDLTTTPVMPLSIPLQALYRAWSLREADLERVRPFFTNDNLRSKILPLEVDIISSQNSTSGERQSKQPRQRVANDRDEPKRKTLSLRPKRVDV